MTFSTTLVLFNVLFSSYKDKIKKKEAVIT